MPVAIVTGASRGIGRAIALRLADDGMDITINDLDNQATLLEEVRSQVEQKGRKCLCFAADITDENQVRDMVTQTVKAMGDLTVMVANAGIIMPMSMMDTDLGEFSLASRVYLSGTVESNGGSARQMIKQGKGGRIIGASSLAAYRPSHGSTPYAASKWAVRGLTQSMAYDLAEHDINVNAYCPGPVDTPMWDQIDEALAKGQGLAKGEAFARSVQARCGLKRPSARSVPDDIAAMVSFMAGPGARNITGQAMIVDGGKHLPSV
ncbi:uncharacterized protein Z520_09227 [Fonsecaea multimorphosa CBS 102226]|uniref:Diacetyl reductase [(S)-acetoin forming] n=1 Tax=Fonsecaea multimorphosa CBS 102226 TaxID=1442371 RepID=A0A0D2JNN2_9EURO|nr:uncharacterized protein Z520_09227 [Fonsecaea multimorphosa CBS 102226]KIX94917.1 hypothetical protein Z520_09227 [Fonsecaea multimorphosa CBS 102226]